MRKARNRFKKEESGVLLRREGNTMCEDCPIIENRITISH
jgi:hypothetical protein